MKKILIVGSGNIGTRYLEGLTKIKLNVNIFVLDNSKKALKTARMRIENQEYDQRTIKIGYFSSISKIPYKNIDLAILSTNSDVRFNIFKVLINNFNVKYFILEKFLFQRNNDYKDALALLNNFNSKCWINNPRRIFPSYEIMKKLIDPSKPLKIEIVGGLVRLCSNGIHFLDLFSWYINSLDVDIAYDGPDDCIIRSKRDGFIEMKGQISGISDKGHRIIIKRIEKFYNSKLLRITNGNMKYIVSEEKQKVAIYRSNKFVIWEDFKIPFLSEIIPKLAEEILTKGHCNLPSLNKSSELHLKLLNVFRKKLLNIEPNRDWVSIPIT